MDIRPGDVIFVWSSDFISGMIERITDGPAHVAMIVDENTISEAQVGRPIGERPISFYIDKANHIEVWRDETLTDDERAEMIRFAKTMYGQPYDYALIPLELLHFEFGMNLSSYHEHKARLCSTYVCEIASYVGHQWSSVVNPAPVDEIRSGKLKKVYEWDHALANWSGLF